MYNFVWIIIHREQEEIIEREKNMSYLEGIPFLDRTEFFFKAEQVAMKEGSKKREKWTPKIFIEDLHTQEILAYFDQPYYNPKSKFTLKDMNNRPLLFLQKQKAMQKKARFWIYSLEDDTNTEELGANSPNLVGEMARKKMASLKFYFYQPGVEDMFIVKPNWTSTHVKFENLMSNDPELLAEGDNKMITTWGWDWEFNLKIHPSCDKFLRCMLICCMLAVRTTFD